MKHHFSVLVFAAAAALILTLIPGCGDDKFDMQVTLDKAMEAQRKGDAAAWIALLDPESVEHNDRILNAARTANRAQVRLMPPYERATIAILRTKFSGAELQKLDARGMIRASMEPDNSRRSDLTLGQVKIRMPRAQAQLVVNGSRTNIWLEFVKVEDQWLFSQRAYDDWINETMREAARQTNRSEDYIALQVASRITGRYLDDRVWDGPPK